METKPLRLILVVEEDAAVRAFLKDSLMEHGYGVWAVASAAMAISILRERRIDLIVGDAAGLEPDGEKTLRKLRRSGPSIKVLAMTESAQSQRSRLKARLFLGAHAILPKPVSANQLIETVKKLLGDDG